MQRTAPTRLDPPTRRRLAQLLGMCGSDNDGEVTNAARLADRLVRQHGSTWLDVIGTDAIPPPARPPRQADRPSHATDPLRQFPSRAAACRFVLRRQYLPTDWELTFTRSLASQRRITPKQANVLRRLVLRAEDAA